MSTTSNKPQVPSPPAPCTYPLTSPRGARLATRTWSPKGNGGGKPRAIVVIVHGGGWHSGYFGYLAHHLNQHQIFVAAYDQPGCGYSEPDPNAPPGFTHVYDFDELVDEVYEAVEWAQKEAGGTDIPLFLLGESFGGIQVLMAALETNERGRVRIAGAIVLGGLIRVAKNMLPPRPVVKILMFLAPYYAKTRMPTRDFSETFDDAFGDKEWATVARGDPKVDVSPKYTLGAAASTLSSEDVLLARAADFPVPLLAIHGMRDCRTECEAMQEFVDRVGTDAEIVLVDTDGHQLLQDRAEITNQVVEKVTSWVKAAIANRE